MKRLSVMVLVVLAAACGGTATTDDVAQNAPVTIDGSTLAPFATPDPAIGSPAPQLSGTDFDGNAVTIDPTSGPQLILFVAHWCGHCQAEVPELSEWLAEGNLDPGVGISIVNTAVDATGPNYPPSDWLGESGLTVPILRDDVTREAAASYGLTAFPYWVAVDAEGLVVFRHSGRLPMDAVDTLVRQIAG